MPYLSALARLLPVISPPLVPVTVTGTSRCRRLAPTDEPVLTSILRRRRALQRAFAVRMGCAKGLPQLPMIGGTATPTMHSRRPFSDRLGLR